MYNRHPRLPQALNVCETDAAFEFADPEEELELKLAGVKALLKRYGKTLKRHRGNKKRLLRQRKGNNTKEEQVEVEELPLTLKHMYQAEYIVSMQQSWAFHWPGARTIIHVDGS